MSNLKLSRRGLLLSAAATAARPKELLSLPEIRIRNPQERTKPLAAEIPKGSAAERPPWVVRLSNGVVRCFIGTTHAEAYNLRPGRSLLSDRDAIDAETCQHASIDILRALKYPAPEEFHKRPEYWRSHYYGLISAHRMAHPKTAEPCLVGVIHGENKDMAWSKKWAEKGHHPAWSYPNTVLPQIQLKENDRKDGRYLGFAGLAWCAEREAGGADFMPRDLGPIVWPEAGYLDADGNRINSGVRHPYGFLDGDWFYVFYLDTTDNTIRAARAPLSRIFEPGAFRLCYRGEFTEPALPSGFQKEDRRFLQRKAGHSDHILGNFHSVRFQVTRLRGTKYFLGVEHRTEQSYEVWLHVSRDLIHWSEGCPVPGTRGGFYESELGQRPIAVNRDYTGHEEVDANGFYLAATHDRTWAGTYLRYMQIDIV